MKRIISVLLVLAMCAVLFTGCTRDENDKGPIIRMYISSYPRSLDPSAYQVSAETTKLFGLIYEALTAVDDEGKVVPALAESWYGLYDNKDELYKMYFVLNETKWSDGADVTADDVIFAWKRILMPESNSPYASLLYLIDNAKDVKSGVVTIDALGLAAVDDTLLEVTFDQTAVHDQTTLDNAVALFAETVSSLALVPLRENVVSKGDDWMTTASEATTNGPFKVQTMEYESQIILERSTYYRLTEDDKFDKYVKPYKIVIDYYSNGQNAAQWQQDRFNNGDIYYLGSFTPDGYATFEDLKTSNMLSSSAVYFNNTDPLLDDARVRKALSMVIDRTALVQAVDPTFVPATGWVPHGVFNTSAEQTFREASSLSLSATADVDGAKALLREAGVSGGEIKLTYRSSNFDKLTENTANFIKSAWEQLGFTVTLERLGGVNYTQSYDTRAFQAILTDMVGNMTDAFGYLAPFARYYSGQVVSVSLEDEAYTPHITGFESDSYDALIDSIVFEVDRTKRAELLHQAEAALLDEMPACPLYFYTESYVVNEDLSKVGDYYFGYRDFCKIKLKDYLKVTAASESAVAAEDGQGA